MLILLPPSEGKVLDGGQGTLSECAPDLVADVEAILKHVGRLSLADRMKFYGLKSEEKAKAVHKLNRAVLDGPCLCALERYSGVVYQHLDFGSLKNKRKARERIWIVSGLFGAIAGKELIPPYKMPINTWLTRYWREKNEARIAKAARRRSVLSLLPQAYAKAVDLDGALHVDFRVEGGRKAAGHSGKAIKGRFARFLIEHEVVDTKDFGAFREDGFRFDGTNFVQG